MPLRSTVPPSTAPAPAPAPAADTLALAQGWKSALLEYLAPAEIVREALCHGISA